MNFDTQRAALEINFVTPFGLEWAVEAGDIFDARSLGGWLVDLITFGAPRADAILFAAAFRAVEAGGEASSKLILPFIEKVPRQRRDG